MGRPDGSTDTLEGMDDALHDAQQLFKAAERIIKESCTEKWLLQPFIPDMERNEYRYQTTTALAARVFLPFLSTTTTGLMVVLRSRTSRVSCVELFQQILHCS